MSAIQIRKDAAVLFQQAIMSGYVMHELMVRGEEASIHLELAPILLDIKEKYGYRYLLDPLFDPDPQQFLCFHTALHFSINKLGIC